MLPGPGSLQAPPPAWVWLDIAGLLGYRPSDTGAQLREAVPDFVVSSWQGRDLMHKVHAGVGRAVLGQPHDPHRGNLGPSPSNTEPGGGCVMW